jgi:S-adenosylmethionine synthetase
MAQALYAHMNNKTIKKKEIELVIENVINTKEAQIQVNFLINSTKYFSKRMNINSHKLFQKTEEETFPNSF